MKGRIVRRFRSLPASQVANALKRINKEFGKQPSSWSATPRISSKKFLAERLGLKMVQLPTTEIPKKSVPD